MGGDDWRGSTGIKLMASFSFSKAAGVICIISDSGEVMALKAPTGDAVNQIIYLADRCVVYGFVCMCVCVYLCVCVCVCSVRVGV